MYNDDEDDDDGGDGDDDEGYESFGVPGGEDSSHQAAVLSLELLKSQSPFEIYLTFISLLNSDLQKTFQEVIYHNYMSFVLFSSSQYYSLSSTYCQRCVQI